MPKYAVQRSIEVEAPAERVYQTVVDFSTWSQWSPWLCCEPDANVTITDDPSGVGSKYDWSGELVGAGQLEHMELVPNQRVDDEIRFFKPFRSEAKVGFELEERGGNIQLTWYMHGSLPWFLLWMKPQLEIMIGMDYERGLLMVKEYIEQGKVDSRVEQIGVESIGPIVIYGIAGECSFENIGEEISRQVVEAAKRFEAAGIEQRSERITVYHRFDIKAQRIQYTCGFIVREEAAEVPSALSRWALTETRALGVRHFGSYRHLGNAWSAANQIARYRKLKQSKQGAFEIYKGDPATQPASEVLTEVWLPLK